MGLTFSRENTLKLNKSYLEGFFFKVGINYRICQLNRDRDVETGQCLKKKKKNLGI